MPDYWNDTMHEATARRVLGSGHFEYAVAQGAAFCRSRATAAWSANNSESFAAYNKAAEIAGGVA